MEYSVAAKRGREFETCPFSCTQFVLLVFLHCFQIEAFEGTVEVLRFILSFSVDIFKGESFERPRNVVIRNP